MTRRRASRIEEVDARLGIRATWRLLGVEQRVAAVAALLLIVSTFGPFSFVEAAVVLTGLAVLALVRQRAHRRRFHLPLGDGTVVLVAGGWVALLILVRLPARPLGQTALALVCAALLAAAGQRERSRRPPDDLPAPRPAPPTPPTEDPTERISGEPAEPRTDSEQPTVARHDTDAGGDTEDPTIRLPRGEQERG